MQTYATDFLDKCFYSREKISKINGYMLCDSELNLSNKNYTSNKKISGRMLQGKTDLVVSDIYLIDSLIDLINLEMMYAVINDMPINNARIAINILLPAMPQLSFVTDFIRKIRLASSSAERNLL